MHFSGSTVFWREVVSEGRASSYLVTECPAPRVGPETGSPGAPSEDPPTAADLVLKLARAFFEGITDCSGGLFAASYREDPGLGARPPLVRDPALHPRGLRYVPLIRLGSPRLWQSRDHAVLVYPVTGGPLAGRPATGEERAAISLVADESGDADTAGSSPDPRAPGVWDIGAMAFDVLRFGGTLSLSVMVCDYPPRLVGSGRSLLRNALYRMTQSPVHRLLVARFLGGAAEGVTRAGTLPD